MQPMFLNFQKSVKRRKGKGLFVHTGRTGAMSKEIASSTDVEIISGSKLLKAFIRRSCKTCFFVFKL